MFAFPSLLPAWLNRFSPQKHGLLPASPLISVPALCPPARGGFRRPPLNHPLPPSNPLHLLGGARGRGANKELFYFEAEFCNEPPFQVTRQSPKSSSPRDLCSGLVAHLLPNPNAVPGHRAVQPWTPCALVELWAVTACPLPQAAASRVSGGCIQTPLARGPEDPKSGAEMSMVCVTDFEAQARELLSKSTWEYIDGGADDGLTRADNVAAFKKIRLRPRYLRDVSQVDTRTAVQGQEIGAPIGIAPTGFHCLAWPDGELSTARAAQAAGICYITSTYASCTLEDIVAAAPRGLRWFQLYMQQNRQLNKQLIRRAESLGFKALVLTVDVPKVGNRRHDIRNQLDLKMNLMLKDLRSPKERNSVPHLQMSPIDSSLCWNDLSWLQSLTQLPIILKGILTKEDAELALKHKVQGVIVSNHGGRQLDGVPASIDALTEVVAAVKGKIEVYLDGGVRTGGDVLKALALGAKCVFLGRPVLWGLACKGERGVAEVLNILKEEFHTSMALTGCRSVAEISRDLIQSARL